MTTQSCFGWSLEPTAVEILDTRGSTFLAKQMHSHPDPNATLSPGLKSAVEEAALSRIAHQKPFNFCGRWAFRERDEDKYSCFEDPWNKRGRVTRRERVPISVRMRGFCREGQERGRLVEHQLEARLCEAPLPRGRLPESSHLSRWRRRRRAPLAPDRRAPLAPDRRAPLAPNRNPTTVRGQDEASRDRIFSGMNQLQAKLVNMSARNGSLILLAWNLNEEFQLIEKNVESLMEDMKSLHQDLKDLRFANDLLYLLKGDLDHVSLKRWPFMILNENFCENPQQEFNLII
ncbi:uncharacterized protein [Bemisia tabaci]|uniref:uncharacterized protein isoform X2 n=1 Tax=Bemisia tabaci TaxID=7038 RepID=UPI003B2883B8